jgi:hypothetical protein
MAYLITTDNKKVCISGKVGAFLWKSLNDPDGTDKHTAQQLKKVKKLYLDWHNAPDSYIRENLNAIIDMALDEWAVDGSGEVVRPASDRAWQFAKRWGLWEFGRPTGLVVIPTGTTIPGVASFPEINNSQAIRAN